MESQPQNPEYRDNPESFYSCISKQFPTSLSRQLVDGTKKVMAIL